MLRDKLKIKIKNINNVELITPQRVNTKNKTLISSENKQLLSTRYKVEHFFNLLKNIIKKYY